MLGMPAPRTPRFIMPLPSGDRVEIGSPAATYYIAIRKLCRYDIRVMAVSEKRKVHYKLFWGINFWVKRSHVVVTLVFSTGDKLELVEVERDSPSDELLAQVMLVG